MDLLKGFTAVSRNEQIYFLVDFVKLNMSNFKFILVMKYAILKTAICLALTALTGCSPVKFYSNSGLTESSGLKYYTVNPYLTVEKEAVSNNVVKVSVVYMPDLENPQFIVLKDGPGARKVDLKLTDGSISTLGLSTDPKISESIEALSGLLSKSVSAIGELSNLKGLPPSAGASIVTELYEVKMSNGFTSLKKIEIR
jgi:hypothetical protein